MLLLRAPRGLPSPLPRLPTHRPNPRQGARAKGALCRRALLVRRGLRSRDRLRRADRSRELVEARVQAHSSACGDLSRHGCDQGADRIPEWRARCSKPRTPADEIRAWRGLLWSERWTHRRDFIVIAQRGTNWTDSNLSCPAFRELWRRLDGMARSDEGWRREMTGATVACARRLAIGHDLSGYNTTQSARDVAALRQALGLEAWSVYAVSYGTRFALSLMKNHPAGLRSVVLDSTYPPGIGPSRTSRRRLC
jgi:hypothetical protein